jgi:hypothetical protein
VALLALGLEDNDNDTRGFEVKATMRTTATTKWRQQKATTVKTRTVTMTKRHGQGRGRLSVNGKAVVRTAVVTTDLESLVNTTG